MMFYLLFAVYGLSLAELDNDKKNSFKDKCYHLMPFGEMPEVLVTGM